MAQDVHLVCPPGWRYQEVDFGAGLKAPRMIYQEKKVRKGGFGGRNCGQRHPATKVYGKKSTLFLECGRVKSALYLEAPKQQVGKYFKRGFQPRRKQYPSVLVLPFHEDLFLYLSS